MGSIKMDFDPDDFFSSKRSAEDAATNAIRRVYPDADFTVDFNEDTGKYNVTGLTQDELAKVKGFNFIVG